MIEPEPSGQFPYIPPRLSWAPGYYQALVAPTLDDDVTRGFNIGSHWYKILYPYQLFECVDNYDGSAIWREIGLTGTTPTVFSCLASETITGPALVNLHNDSGTIKARNADASDNTRPVDGFLIVTAPTAGASAHVFTADGNIISNLSGLTVGDTLYLSETAGAVTATAPVGAGKIVQQIGKALTATTALFRPLEPMEL